MINYHTLLFKKLNWVLPTYYERILTSKIKVPCISYMELNNYESDFVFSSDKPQIQYSHIIYQVTVWATEMEETQTYTAEVDKIMRDLGFKRISSNEILNNPSAIQKILVYEALASEEI